MSFAISSSLHEIGETIAAEQQAVIVGEMHQIHIDLDRRVGPPDDVREDVAHAVPGRFVPGHLTAIHQLLHERVIARELVQGVAPKQVGARVADVDDLQVVSQAQRRS